MAESHAAEVMTAESLAMDLLTTYRESESLDYWLQQTTGKLLKYVAQHNELIKFRTALNKISAIRDSIVGKQGFNFSEHAYPLVAALDEAGFPGAGYEVASKNFGTMLERTTKAEAEVVQLRIIIADQAHHRAADLAKIAEQSARIVELNSSLINIHMVMANANVLLTEGAQRIADLERELAQRWRFSDVLDVINAYYWNGEARCNPITLEERLTKASERIKAGDHG
jgi:hypothetical protein